MRLDPPELCIPTTIRTECAALAEAAHPREACGLLIGERFTERHVVSHLVSITNLSDAEDAFQLEPLAWRRAESAAREKGEVVLGVWHSHPRTSASPSPRDHEGAQPGWSHAISGLLEPASLKSYFLLDGELLEQAVSYR